MTSVSSTTSGTTTSTSTTSSSSSSSSSSSTSSSDYASSDVTDIDWDGLIEEMYEAKLSAADTYESKITENESKISAYEDAESLLSTLQDAAEALRAPTGTLDSSDDVFLERAAYLTAVGGVDTDTTLSVTCDSGADTGTYSLAIQQLATANKVASSDQTSSSTDLGLSGSFTLGIEDGDSTTITIDEDMSLADIAQAINDESDTTGVQATVLKVSDSSYQLILSTTETGETISVSDTDGVLNDLGIVDDTGAFADELQKAQDAIFTLDGVTLTRSTNEVDDALDGVTLYLYSTTDDDQSITVEVQQNLSDIKTAVTTFVDAYNAYREWAETQQETSSSGGASSDAVLFGDGTIRGINTNIASALNFSIDTTALATLGITFDENNELVLDDDTLSNVLLDDPSVVEDLFAYNFDSSSSDLRLLSRGTGAPSTFTLDVTTDDDGNVTGVSVDGDDSLFTVSGALITGATGTEFEGYSFVFTGDSSQTITVTQSAGIAEQIYNIADTAINSDDGSLVTLVDSLTSKNEDYQDQIDDITTRAETYKENLTTRYAKLQAKISEAQSTLTYLEALLNSSSSSSS